MSEDTQASIESRMKGIMDEFEKLGNEFRANAKRNSEIQAKQLELRGAYQELEKLVPEKEEAVEVVEEPKEIPVEEEEAK